MEEEVGASISLAAGSPPLTCSRQRGQQQHERVKLPGRESESKKKRRRKKETQSDGDTSRLALFDLNNYLVSLDNHQSYIIDGRRRGPLGFRLWLPSMSRSLMFQFEGPQ